MQSRIADIEKRAKNLENEIVDLWETAKGIPENEKETLKAICEAGRGQEQGNLKLTFTYLTTFIDS